MSNSLVRVKIGKKARVQNVLYWITSIIGGVLFTVSMGISSDTIIDMELVFAVFFLIGFLASLMDWKRFSNTYSHFVIPKSLIVFFLNTLFWGSLVLFTFFATNTYFKEIEPQEHSCKILAREFLPAKTGKYPSPALYAFNIKYKNRIEYVTFPAGVLHIENYKTVKLYTQKGFWGYDVITAKILLSE